MGLVVFASCGGVDDVCAATASDFAGTYAVLIDDVVRCFCGETPDMSGDCASRCRDQIAQGATCNREQTFCEYYRREPQTATFTIGSDGSVEVLSTIRDNPESVAADCDVDITNFCDLSFSCMTSDGPITATWKKVK